MPSHAGLDQLAAEVLAVRQDYVGHRALVAVCGDGANRDGLLEGQPGGELLGPLAPGLALLRGVYLGEAYAEGLALMEDLYGVAILDGHHLAGEALGEGDLEKEQQKGCDEDGWPGKGTSHGILRAIHYNGGPPISNSVPTGPHVTEVKMNLA